MTIGIVLGRLLGGADRLCTGKNQDIDWELHDFRYEARNLVRLLRGVAKLNEDILSLNVP